MWVADDECGWPLVGVGGARCGEGVFGIACSVWFECVACVIMGCGVLGIN